MNLMYPHEIDRLRAARCLLLAWRKELDFSQKEIATEANLTPGTISGFMGLDGPKKKAELREKKEKLAGRETALRVLIRGLERYQKDVDALLWLYYGERFKPVDVNERYMDFNYEKEKPRKRHVKIGQANQYTDKELRQHVMKLLIDAVKILIDEPIKQAEVQMIFDFHEDVGVAGDKTLLNLENEPGQRLVVSKYPSYLTYPLGLYEDSQWRSSFVKQSEEGKQKHQELTGKRRENFLEQLKKYGERSIHSKESIVRYLQYGMKNSILSAEQRIRHIEHWIELIRTNNYYQVGLAEEEPDLDLLIKNTVGVFLTGLPAETSLPEKQGQEKQKKQGTHYGPRYILWRDKESIFSFFVDFERNWAAIPEEMRNRENVIKWLSEKVEEARDGKCR